MKPEGEPQMWDPSLWDIKSRKGKKSSGDSGGPAVLLEAQKTPAMVQEV